MKHQLDPNNDYVVKMMFARQKKSHLLVHFLNSVIEPTSPIVEVFIQDPHKQRQTEKDKLTIADSLAKDSHGTIYQVEIQNYAPDYLGSRISYTSSAIYGSQLISGEQYDVLRPIHSIWLLNDTMFDNSDYRHNLQVKDYETKAHLPHSNFHILELPKWQPEMPLEQMDEQQLLALQPIYYWLYFMQEAKNWLSLPPSLQCIPIMRELMDILNEISDREENYFQYLSAQDAMRVKLTDEALKKEAQQKLAETNEELNQKQQELSVKKEELSVKSEELSEAKQVINNQSEQLEQYRAKLIAAGIDPDNL